MPILSMFYGIVIRMYFFDDKQHHMPHLHAEYAGKRAVFDIAGGEILAGALPPGKTRLVQDFHLENGQFGQVQLYSYIARSVGWNYFHPTWKIPPPASGGPGDHFNGQAEHLYYNTAWLDRDDPTYQGRPA